jgi:hypothetical protein
MLLEPFTSRLGPAWRGTLGRRGTPWFSRCWRSSISWPAATGCERLSAALALLLVLGLGACTEAPAVPQNAEGSGCLDQADLEFGQLPLLAEVDPARLQTHRCIELEPGQEPPALEHACNFRDGAGVVFEVYDGLVSRKSLSLPNGKAAGVPLGLDRSTSVAEVRQRLATRGVVPFSGPEEDGTQRLTVSLCPADTSMSDFTIRFDGAGRARAVELRSTLM